MTRKTRIGCETFLKARSPRLSRTKWARIRSAVVGPTMISPPWAEPANRAATLVVGPVAVKGQRCEGPGPRLVAPTSAPPVVGPLWSWTGGKTPPESPVKLLVRWWDADRAPGAPHP